MRCPSCGTENEADARFCAACGAPVSKACGNCGALVPAGKRFCVKCGSDLEAPQRPPVAASAQEGAGSRQTSARGREAAAPVNSSTPRRKGRGCLGWGCLLVSMFLLLVLLLAGVGAALYFKVPQQLGLVQSPAQRLLSGTPDREAAASIKADMAKRGVDTRGMEIYVIPIAGTQQSVAVATLNASQGFQFKNKGRDALLEYMSTLGTSEVAKAAGVRQIAVDYRDQTGESLVTLTAPSDIASGFARGSVSRQQFMQKLEGKANWPAFFQEVLQ